MGKVTNVPLVLVILDGWGVAPPGPGNAIAQARTANFDRFEHEYPATTLAASGIDVGLMWGVAGNSETGHLNIGSGRIVYQQLPRILFAIHAGEFFKNRVLRNAFANASEHHATVHLAGLLSSGAVHSYIDILYALLDLAHQQHAPRVVLHLWLDGRDSPIHEAATLLANLSERLRMSQVGAIGTVMGRSFAMDRNENWEQTRRAHACMVDGVGRQVTDPVAYLRANYSLGVTDEFIEPAVVTDESGHPVGTIRDGDTVIFFNIRADRVRQITAAVTDPQFDRFPRRPLRDLQVVSMTEYGAGTPTPVAFSSVDITETFAELVSTAGLSQLHIAETEKYAHVTYFFNGRREAAFPGEERLLIPSPRLTSFEANPEMQAMEIAAQVTELIRQRRFDVYVINFANADMVGHTGNITATAEAVAVTDEAVGRVVAAAQQRNGVVLITGDHGNAEQMIDPVLGAPRREHTANPVPFYLIGDRFRARGRGLKLADHQTPHGKLADVAPTALQLLGLTPPPAMTGRSLLKQLVGRPR